MKKWNMDIQKKICLIHDANKSKKMPFKTKNDHPISTETGFFVVTDFHPLSQLMLNWFVARWFGYLGSPL